MTTVLKIITDKYIKFSKISLGFILDHAKCHVVEPFFFSDTNCLVQKTTERLRGKRHVFGHMSL